jgi:hypothetical protein
MTPLGHDDTRVGVGIDQRRHEILPAVPADHVVPSSGSRVKPDSAGVPRVRAAAVDAGACSRHLHGCAGVALEVSVPIWVGDRARQQRREVDQHAVHTDVAVWRGQRLAAAAPGHMPGAVCEALGRVEWPRAPPRALNGGVAHPHVRGSPRRGGPVRPARAAALSLDGDVGGSEHDGHASWRDAEPRRQPLDLDPGQRLPQRARLVVHLVGQKHPRRLPAGLARVPVHRLPPAGHRRRRRGSWRPKSVALRLAAARGEGEQEVGDDGLLVWREGAVVEDGDRHGAVEHLAGVVDHGGRRRRAVERGVARARQTEQQDGEVDGATADARCCLLAHGCGGFVLRTDRAALAHYATRKVVRQAASYIHVSPRSRTVSLLLPMGGRGEHLSQGMHGMGTRRACVRALGDATRQETGYNCFAWKAGRLLELGRQA